MPLNVPYGIIGSTGRMGHEIMAAAGKVPCLCVWDTGESCEGSPKVIFDFSSPEVTSRTVELCRAHHSALVIGTTALEEQQIALLRDLAQTVPVVQSFNYSIGITVMAMILRTFGPMLADWDAEISETHHIHKKDAPSGTALLLQRALGRAVPMHSFRLGGMPGDHEAFFANEGEVLSIKHHAISRSVFAIGAVKAAEFAVAQSSGFFTFEDVLKESLSRRQD
ncbi:MAG: dihydrodipicolinate reductase C-terminal domain-containing protein [Pyramidobacter sp.]|nr:dihydrodipicolinate reductase C-terminal domain-containing protein [Pyramidobacter sp.]